VIPMWGRFLQPLVLLIAISFLTSNVAMAQDRDDLAPFLSKWGAPNSQDSTEYDQPRPPLVTKFLVYRTPSLDLRADFLALGHVGDPPPYHAWRLIGIQDNRTNAVVDAGKALELLRARLATKHH